MKTVKSRVIKGTIAAAVILGAGAAGLAQYAYADTVGSSTYQPAGSGSPAASQAVPGASAPGKKGGRGFGDHGGHGVGPDGGFLGLNEEQETAKLLGIDETALRTELQQGKTLAQVAQEKGGLSEDALVQKLTDAANQSLATAVKDGKITQAQADQQKSGLADHIKKEVTENRPDGMHEGGRGGHGGPGFGPMGGSPDELAKIIGVTTQELTDALKAGKSPAEIAQDKGISKADLVAKIKEGMTDRITKFVDEKHTPRANGPQAPAPAASAAPAN